MAAKRQGRANARESSLVSLRERLKTAEETLEAIRSGAVDALVISGVEGEQIFTLKGADHRYRRLVETMNEGAATITKDGFIAYCNMRFAEMFQRRHEVVVGSSLLALVAPNSRKTAAAFLRRASEETTRVELEMSTSAGDAVPVYLSGTPNSGDDLAAICLVATDLTEQRKKEELVAAERLAASIIDQAAEALVVCDADGRIVRASQAGHRLAGRNPVLETFSRAFPLRPLPPGDAGSISAIIDAVVGGEAVAGVETTLPRPDGQPPLTLLLSGAPLVKADGAVIGGVVSLVDISARRDAEQRLHELAESERRARKAAEAATRAKDDFLAMVSHELRTPLNAIVGWTRLLSAGRLSQEKQEHALATIDRNARAQAQLIDDLLDVNRIISGKLRLRIERVDLAAVVHNAVDAVQPSADAKGVGLFAAVDADVDPVLGDPDRLKQVVWNLLVNSVKFTPKGGRVDIRLRRDGGQAEIVVEDTGAGIAPEFLPFVFDRFRQADPSSSRAAGGLGLGLAIVRHLVNQHGGQVKAESAGTGHGATFALQIPLAPVRAAMAAPPAAAARKNEDVVGLPLNGIGVIAVDDDADSRDLLLQMLSDRGAHVRAASTAAEGLALLRQSQPDVLLSDLGMPGEDGFAFIKRVRSLPPDQGGLTPALALSGYARSEDRTRAILAGFDMHLPKPVDPSELAVVVSRMAGHLAVREREQPPAADEPALPHPSPATVLIIDDAEDAREMLAEILKDAGYNVATACHGAEGLDRLRHGLKAQLILLDLMMPVMDGWQFREQQKKDAALAVIPVVVVSATATGTATGTNRPIDAAAVLSKPVDVDALLEVVQTHVAQAS